MFILATNLLPLFLCFYGSCIGMYFLCRLHKRNAFSSCFHIPRGAGRRTWNWSIPCSVNSPWLSKVLTCKPVSLQQVRIQLCMPSLLPENLLSQFLSSRFLEFHFPPSYPPPQPSSNISYDMCYDQWIRLLLVIWYIFVSLWYDLCGWLGVIA